MGIRKDYKATEFEQTPAEVPQGGIVYSAEASGLGWPPPTGLMWAPPFVIVIDDIELIFSERDEYRGEILSWRYVSRWGKYQAVVYND